jgi:hypothetical protein
MKIEKKLEEVRFIFAGNSDWFKFRNLIVLKLSECRTEVQFNKVFKKIIASCFLDVEALNEARKSVGIKPLSEKEMKKLKRLQEKKNV